MKEEKKSNRKLIGIAVLAVIVLAIVGSIIYFNLKREDKYGVILSDNAVAVDSLMDKGLVSINDSQLVFLEETPNLKKIKINSVIISDFTANAPAGYLRKVKAIENKNGKVSFSTEPAALTDLIVQCDIVIPKINFDTLNPFNPNIYFKNQTILLDQSKDNRLNKIGNELNGKMKKEFSIPINKTLFENQQLGEFGEISEHIELTGNLSFTPECDFVLKIKESKIEKFEIGFNATTILGLKLLAQAQFEGKQLTVRDSIELPRIQLPSFEIPVGFVVIPFAQSIIFTLDATAALRASIETGITDTLITSIRLTYKDTLNYIPHFDNKFERSPILFRGTAKAEAGISVEYRISPVSIEANSETGYISVGVRSGLRGEAGFAPELDTLKSDSLYWKLIWRTNLFGKAGFKVFNHNLFEYKLYSPPLDSILKVGQDYNKGQKEREEAFNTYGSFEALIEAYNNGDTLLIGKNIVPKKIYFDYNKANHKKESEPDLNKAVEGILILSKILPTIRLKIVGYTDNQGSDEYNLKLSNERANSVYSYLVEHGIDSVYIDYEGRGKAEPEFENISEENQAKNRRTKFIIVRQ
jgi:outer membrane protein OmpA-like peptidoglycan-associated protein